MRQTHRLRDPPQGPRTGSPLPTSRPWPAPPPQNRNPTLELAGTGFPIRLNLVRLSCWTPNKRTIRKLGALPGVAAAQNHQTSINPQAVEQSLNVERAA